MGKLLVILLTLLNTHQYAQAMHLTDSQKVRKPEIFTMMTFGTLAFSQQQVNDWKEGEKNSFDLKAGFKENSMLTLPSLIFSTVLKLQLGMTREEISDTLRAFYRSTDNELSGEAKFVLPLGWQIDPFINLAFKTQITESYKQVFSALKRTAGFWDPVTSEQSCGFTYSTRIPGCQVALRAGANLQQIRSESNTMLTDDFMTSALTERYKARAGMECVLDAQLKVDSALSYTGRYSGRKNLITNDAWQVQIENEFRLKIWKVFGITVVANLAYDELLSKRVQFKQSTMFGLLLDF